MVENQLAVGTVSIMQLLQRVFLISVFSAGGGLRFGGYASFHFDLPPGWQEVGKQRFEKDGDAYYVRAYREGGRRDVFFGRTRT